MQADDDGSGELDKDEFCDQLGPHLGRNMPREKVAQLFMKIDSNAGGTVDWDEFCDYMFMNKGNGGGPETADTWRLFPAVRRRCCLRSHTKQQGYSVHK